MEQRKTVRTMSADEFRAIDEQMARHSAWLRQLGRNWYYPEECPTDCRFPSWENWSAWLFYMFMQSPTRPGLLSWDGEAVLSGTYHVAPMRVMRSWRSNMGDRRMSIMFSVQGVGRFRGIAYDTGFLRVTSRVN